MSESMLSALSTEQAEEESFRDGVFSISKNIGKILGLFVYAAAPADKPPPGQYSPTPSLGPGSGLYVSLMLKQEVLRAFFSIRRQN